MPEVKEFNEELRSKLDAYRLRGAKPMTLNALGRELGVSGTRVCKYLAGKPEGNAVELEGCIQDMLKSASRRTISDVPPFGTNVTDIMQATFELVRKTNDVGLISGPAGIGKSVVIRMYTARNPLALAISVPRWQRTDGGMVALLFGVLDASSWDRHSARSRFLADRLKGSNRLIIVDNAHRMTSAARQWMFDFHDETGCPVALVGNPEVLDAIRQNDQQFSRIGIHQRVVLDVKRLKLYAQAMVDALITAPQAGLYDLALEVAEERGHLRALKKQLLLAADLAASAAFGGDQVKAFTAAHTKLVRDYQL